MSPIVLDQPLPQMSGVHPSLRSFADECSAVFVRLLAYICGLAVLATIAVDLFAAVPSMAVMPQAPLPGWSPASRPHPAFAISQLDLTGRTDAYEILRHPDGGRKDILRWAFTVAESPTSEIEIYRTGNEVDAFAAPDADLAARMGTAGEAETAGVIDTKFGPIAILRFGGQESTKAHSCMGFAKFFGVPKIRISGWSCQGDSPAAQRAHLACTLNRLTLLSAGNDPRIAELFARAELKRAGCPTALTPGSEWIAAAQEPQLRGSF
jgi:hypothetical protein